MGVEYQAKAGIGIKILPDKNNSEHEQIFDDFEYWAKSNLEDIYRGVVTGDCWTTEGEYYIWLNTNKYPLMHFNLKEESNKLKELIEKYHFKIDSYFDLHETLYVY